MPWQINQVSKLTNPLGHITNKPRPLLARGYNFVLPVRLSFTFLNQRVFVESDDFRYLEPFRRLYPRAIDSVGRAEHCTAFQMWTDANNPFGAPVLVNGDEVYHLQAAQPHPIAIHDWIIERVKRRLGSYFLVHAGVVGRAGKAVLLVGDAFYSKSTLTLELTRRGYLYLSDDRAAINRGDEQVYPFPRCLSVRPSSAGHLGLTLPGEIDDIFGNYLFDIEELFPGQMGVPVPIGAVCILGDAAIMPETPGTTSEHLVHVWVENPTPAFLDELGRLKGTANLIVRHRETNVHITLTTGDKAGIVDRIRALCGQHGVHLVGVSTDMGHRPDFSNSPFLTPISPSQAAIYMLQRLRGGRDTLLQTVPGGKATHLFAELVELIGGAPCYVLSVGPLKEMADLIDSIPLSPAGNE